VDRRECTSTKEKGEPMGGDTWGQRGYFWMPFQVIAGPETDLWTVHTGGPWNI